MKSGVLCPRCQELVDTGKVEEREVDIMRALIELEESGKLPELRDAVYHRAYFIDSNMVIIVMDVSGATSVPVFTRLARKIEGALSEKLGGIRVRIVPRAGDVRTLAVHLLYPARVLGVNYVYMPDGTIEYVVRISRRDRRRVEPQKEFLERVLTELAGQKVRLRFE
ncbi:putative transcription elongation factor [Pyrolobus fumarii 1A]|uniref:Putative transcription elongation factor n=1 Tax=Pyrolobus fumarii (strain DSM 11204 / 1A) TaxID=694429 RepID=G0EEE7_PYRF1|nr:transcription elongation factor [Pyrolobus fumarii]AEM37988.1 putative transcription elongation factor [Pyrolobus fumarii 1A]